MVACSAPFLTIPPTPQLHSLYPLRHMSCAQQTSCSPAPVLLPLFLLSTFLFFLDVFCLKMVYVFYHNALLPF